MNQLQTMTFAYPYVLLLLGLIPPLIYWWVRRDRDSKDSVRFSSLALLGPRAPSSWRTWGRYLPMALRVFAFSLLVVALARPQTVSRDSNSTVEGIDIVISLDISASMLARDFEPNRFEAAKEIGAKFVAGRTSDRMGLVVFAGEAITLCPLTTDLATVINQFNNVQMGVLEDGTAIGSGLAMAVNRLRTSDAVSRVVILLTDGVNNSGEIAPYTAAEIAATYGVRVYVIGVGTMGKAPYPTQTPFGTRYQYMEVNIDEPQMKQIAQLTDGEYFRATDNEALERIYQEIDALEKSKIHVNEFTKRHEAFEPYLLWGVILLLLSIFTQQLLLPSLPSDR